MPVKKTRTKKVVKGTKKLYILDTNILVHDPKALYAFEGALVGVPVVVLEELDKFKHEGTDRGRNSRQAIRLLDGLREHGSLRDGVALDNGAKVIVLFMPSSAHIDISLSHKSDDNSILLIAEAYQAAGYDVVFVSKDLNARVKADAIGLATSDYVKEHVSQEEFYHGWLRVQVPAVELKSSFPSVLHELMSQLVYNEFVLVESRSNPHNYRIFRYLGGKQFKSVHQIPLRWPLEPRNPQQMMAMDLLMDQSVQLVALFGPAGTGKTFLALLAGLHKVLLEQAYEKMLVTRPVIPLGRDIGYLPGTMEEKLYSWMLPIYDNVQYIVHAAKIGDHVHQIRHQEEERGSGHRRSKHHGRKKHKDGAPHHELFSLDEMIKRNRISLEPITYMRGRSIPYQFILVDEAQNLTPHEVKTLVTRVGEGSKMILVGDPYQIDSPYLDFASNGLIAASERFKGQQIFGSVYLETSERSRLSELASELL